MSVAGGMVGTWLARGTTVSRDTFMNILISRFCVHFYILFVRLNRL